jgi:hypothetical protein
VDHNHRPQPSDRPYPPRSNPNRTPPRGSPPPPERNGSRRLRRSARPR